MSMTMNSTRSLDWASDVNGARQYTLELTSAVWSVFGSNRFTAVPIQEHKTLRTDQQTSSPIWQHGTTYRGDILPICFASFRGSATKSSLQTGTMLAE